MQVLILWCTFTLIYYAIAQGNDKSTDAGCECVPYYSCNDGNINKIRDSRFNNTCENYLEVCCENRVTETSRPESLHSCGRRNPDGVGFRITGEVNDETEFGEFPWMVALLQKERETEENTHSYKCGASLIHPQVVLTAGHCVSNTSRQYKIRAGEWDSQSTNELYPHQDRDVKTIVVHPKYHQKALFYDFALLILDTPVEITPNVDVVCLPNKNIVLDNLSCYVTGWGKDKFANKGRLHAVLEKMELPIANREKCEEHLRKTRLGSHFKLHESFICASRKLGRDTCKGDGGAPLVCPITGEKNKYFQAGILAWGLGCAEQNIAGVYAHVAEAMQWIADEMTAKKFDNFPYKY